MKKKDYTIVRVSISIDKELNKTLETYISKQHTVGSTYSKSTAIADILTEYFKK